MNLSFTRKTGAQGCAAGGPWAPGGLYPGDLEDLHLPDMLRTLAGGASCEGGTGYQVMLPFIVHVQGFSPPDCIGCSRCAHMCTRMHARTRAHTQLPPPRPVPGPGSSRVRSWAGGRGCWCTEAPCQPLWPLQGPASVPAGTHTSDEQGVAGDPLHGLQQEAGEGHAFTSRVRCQLLQNNREARGEVTARGEPGNSAVLLTL